MKKINLLLCSVTLLGFFASHVYAEKSTETGFYAVDPNGGLTYLDEDNVPKDYVLSDDGKVQKSTISDNKSRYISKEEAAFRAKMRIVAE